MVLVGGIDIPLTELLFAIGVIGIIVLVEIMVVLLLITYHMRNTKKLGEQIGRLISALAALNKDEFKELNKVREMQKAEESILSKIKKLKKSVKRK